jgi:acyl transferase domain-containing protein
MEADFERHIAGVKLARPRIPVVSNVSGVRAGSEIAEPKYWVDHVRQPVRFYDAMSFIDRQCYRTFVEIGPNPTLLAMGQQCLSGDGQRMWLASLRRGADDWTDLLESLSALYVLGAAVDWKGFDSVYSRSRVGVPHYPFQRTRFWVERSAVRKAKFSPREASPRKDDGSLARHPLLGVPTKEVACRPEERHWEILLDRDRLPYVGFHKIHDDVVLPVSVFSEVALSAAAQAFDSAICRLTEIALRTPLFVPETGCYLQVSLLKQGDGRARFRAYSRPAAVADSPWTLHATASLRIAALGENQ